MRNPVRRWRLRYAPEPKEPWWVRRWFELMVLAPLVVGLLVMAAPPACRRIRNMAAQGQCLGHAAPATQVVYEESPSEAAALLAEKGYVGGDCWLASDSLIRGGAAMYSPSFIADYYQWVWGENREGEALVFSHRRRAPLGSEYLVIVTAVSHRNGPMLKAQALPVLGFTANEKPDSPPRSRRWMIRQWDGPAGICRLAPERRLRLFAGQRHMADAAAFALTYELGAPAGQSAGTISGGVDDHGDVIFSAEPGPICIEPL